jgi:hypothetical protein
MTHRSWFPSILIGLSLMLALVFVFVTKGSPIGSPFGSTQGSAPAVTDADYRAAANTILDAYASNKDVSKAYNALILLRVPREDQQVHFDLVVAFGKLVTKDSKDGEARLAAVKAANPWLHL